MSPAYMEMCKVNHTLLMLLSFMRNRMTNDSKGDLVDFYQEQLYHSNYQMSSQRIICCRWYGCMTKWKNQDIIKPLYPLRTATNWTWELYGVWYLRLTVIEEVEKRLRDELEIKRSDISQRNEQKAGVNGLYLTVWDRLINAGFSLDRYSPGRKSNGMLEKLHGRIMKRERDCSMDVYKYINYKIK